MKKVYSGIIDGNIISLKEKINLPIGTQAIVTLKTTNQEAQEEIKNGSSALLVG